jgi:hypothetical protein
MEVLGSHRTVLALRSEASDLSMYVLESRKHNIASRHMDKRVRGYN